MTADILSTVCEPVREMFCATTCLRVTFCVYQTLVTLALFEKRLKMREEEGRAQREPRMNR